MITDIKIETNIDLSAVGLEDLTDVNTISWRIYDTYKNRKQNLSLILHDILKKINDKKMLSMYLMIGDSSYRENNRLANYFKLWKLLKKEGLYITDGAYFNEVGLTSKEKVKFFGAIRLSSTSSMDEVVNMLIHQINSHLVVLPSGLIVNDILKDGFHSLIKENRDYLSKIINKNGIVLFKEGGFDDMYSGFLGVGYSKLVDELYRLSVHKLD